MRLREQLQKLIRVRNISIRQLSLKSGVRRQSISSFLLGKNLHLKNVEKVLSSFGLELYIRKAATIRNDRSAQFAGRLSLDEGQIKKFCQRHNIRYLALFGSILREDFTKNSDIDVLVEFNQPVSLITLGQIEKKTQSLFKIKQSVDLLTINALSPLLRKEILHNCQVLFEKAA